MYQLRMTRPAYSDRRTSPSWSGLGFWDTARKSTDRLRCETPMSIRSRAPLRISFAGGGTDVPPFPEREGGLVLNATINRYAYGTLSPREDDKIGIESVDFGMSTEFSAADSPALDGKLDLAKAAIATVGEGPDRRGFDLSLHSNAPPGSGLGSSSAMMVALIGVLAEFRNLPLTDYELAEMAFRIERVELDIKGG